MLKNKLLILSMLFLAITTLSLAYGKAASASSEIEWVQAGTILTDDAYVLSEKFGIDTVKLIEAQAEEIKALSELLDKSEQLVMELSYSIGKLTDARLEERSAWQAAADKMNADLRRLKGKRFSFGLYAGHGREWDIGVGISYALFMF